MDVGTSQQSKQSRGNGVVGSAGGGSWRWGSVIDVKPIQQGIQSGERENGDGAGEVEGGGAEHSSLTCSRKIWRQVSVSHARPRSCNRSRHCCITAS